MSKEKTVLFAFRGDPICFVHVLLNGIDLYNRGRKGLIVIEGDAVTLVGQMSEPGHFLSSLYQKAKELGLFHGACKACATKLGAIEPIEKEGIPLIGEMSGHPSMGAFMDEGYEVITF
jgi:hypothetical protein